MHVVIIPSCKRVRVYRAVIPSDIPVRVTSRNGGRMNKYKKRNRYNEFVEIYRADVYLFPRRRAGAERPPRVAENNFPVAKFNWNLIRSI